MDEQSKGIVTRAATLRRNGQTLLLHNERSKGIAARAATTRARTAQSSDRSASGFWKISVRINWRRKVAGRSHRLMPAERVAGAAAGAGGGGGAGRGGAARATGGGAGAGCGRRALGRGGGMMRGVRAAAVGLAAGCVRRAGTGGGRSALAAICRGRACGIGAIRIGIACLIGGLGKAPAGRGLLGADGFLIHDATCARPQMIATITPTRIFTSSSAAAMI